MSRAYRADIIAPMTDDAASMRQRKLEQLRRWRNRPPRDLTLSFLPEHFKRSIEKPHQQLGQLVEIWRQWMPARLLERTTLASLQRGVLTVHVPDSATLYELDRLLRGGVEAAIRGQFKATLQKVRLKVVAESDPGRGRDDSPRA